jgi:uncharacterized protein involved in cysteine biosynthesis
MPCAVCGHAAPDAGCVRCYGAARRLDGQGALQPGRGAAPADLWRGLREVWRAVFALLHARAFHGRLRVPVAMNVVAFLLLACAAWFVLRPWFESLFASFAPRAPGGSAAWLATTWLLLGPPLLDVIAGPAQEPLLDAAERTMLGAPRAAGGASPGMLLRLRDRAKLAAIAVLALPAALLLSLVPWIGLPVVAVLGAAIAAAVWFEPPMAHRGLPLRQRIVLLWRNRWRALGVGAGLQLATAVPFLNLLGLSSVAVLATASAFLQFDKRRTA